MFKKCSKIVLLDYTKEGTLAQHKTRVVLKVRGGKPIKVRADTHVPRGYRR